LLSRRALEHDRRPKTSSSRSSSVTAITAHLLATSGWVSKHRLEPPPPRCSRPERRDDVLLALDEVQACRRPPAATPRRRYGNQAALPGRPRSPAASLEISRRKQAAARASSAEMAHEQLPGQLAPAHRASASSTTRTSTPGTAPAERRRVADSGAGSWGVAQHAHPSRSLPPQLRPWEKAEALSRNAACSFGPRWPAPMPKRTLCLPFVLARRARLQQHGARSRRDSGRWWRRSRRPRATSAVPLKRFGAWILAVCRSRWRPSGRTTPGRLA